MAKQTSSESKKTTQHKTCTVKNAGKCCGKKKFTQRTTSKTKRKVIKKHPKGWESSLHYMRMGGQCGQSCPCCRAQVFLNKIDPDAHFGACEICISKK